MTEHEWLTCTDPNLMLNFLRGKTNDRKLRLFAVACCRHIWHLLNDERSRSGVEIAERYADGEVSGDELASAGSAAEAVSTYSLGRPAAAAEAVSEATWGHDVFGGLYHLSLLIYNAFYATGERASESVAQCRLLGEVIGNPFRPVTITPSCLSWNDRTISKLAQAIYDERAFERLPILADALEEAGCDNADILNHCRQHGEHVRGCWVVDLLLNKS